MDAPIMTVLTALGILLVMLSSRIAVIVGETIALIVSWQKAMGTVREAIRHDVNVSLSRALIQNGGRIFILCSCFEIIKFEL